jgi:hypothetical protein
VPVMKTIQSPSRNYAVAIESLSIVFLVPNFYNSRQVSIVVVEDCHPSGEEAGCQPLHMGCHLRML